MWKVKVIFWLHYTVCLAAHILTPMCIIGSIRLLFVQSQLGFWETTLLLGLVYYSAIFAVNHISNENGFCYLTALETHYRKECKLTKCGHAFLPRFYTKCKQIAKGNLREIPL